MDPEQLNLSEDEYIFNTPGDHCVPKDRLQRSIIFGETEVFLILTDTPTLLTAADVSQP
jgi:hypothetical protein